ncbi:MAG: hypothetical protein MUF54_25270 [Polyangiaceae bacterium]|jgi:hypothetical protein|nr:hypothetical protein [Polyangiaceae bacterium]
MLRLVAIVCVSLLGCGSSRPLPTMSTHTPDEFLEVPYPPPAVRADLVPARPGPDSVWIDGEWHWQWTRWRWRRGAWVTPPAGATFARWETERVGTQVQHAESVFHLADGGSLAPSELRTHAHHKPCRHCHPRAEPFLRETSFGEVVSMMAT